MFVSVTPQPIRPLPCWGPSVADPRWLWSPRINEMVLARVIEFLDVEVDVEMLSRRESDRRYLLLKKLSRKSRSTVFAAIDQVLVREVAVKILWDAEPERAWSFVVEAQTLSRFDHPNIVRVLEFGVLDERPYLVMELCDQDLSEWSPHRPWTEVLDRLLEAGRGLSAVHAAGLVHGDVKPENILLAGGVAKLGDFGLARAPGRTRRISGTPGFIAPEVGEGELGAAGDVFAFACTAWDCLFGAPPFGEAPPRADSSAATLVLLERARDGAFVEPRSAEVPTRVAQALRRALAPRPEARPALDELLDELAWLRTAGPLRRWLWARQRTGRTA